MNRKFLVLAVAILSGLFFYSACTKLDTTDIGSDLIPAVDNVTTFDTVMDVITNLIPNPDSSRVEPGDLHAIGVISNDPEFGKTAAEAYFTMSPPFYGAHPFVNPDSVVIDSIVLALPFNSLYGDSNALERFEVYEINPTSDFKDSLYRISTAPFATLPALLGSKNVDFKTLNDSVFYTNYASTTATQLDSIKTKNQLRIHLDPAWGTKFLNFDTTDAYKGDSAFRSNFKGLAVRINEGASGAANAIAYFSLTGTSPVLTFYSRMTRNGQLDTIAPVFTFPTNALDRSSANLITRTPANGYATTLGNANPNDDKLYIQSSPGSLATIEIPGLANVSNRLIHRAELIFEQEPSALDNIYVPAPLLFIDAINPAGDSTLTIRNDFVLTGQGLGFDLGSIEGVFKNQKYTFNLTRYTQSIVTKKQRSHKLRISAPFTTRPYIENPNGVATVLPFFLVINTPITAYRSVLAGGSHPTKKARLRIIYSKI